MNEMNDRLALSADEMRALGYRVVDLLVEHFDTLEARPVPHRSVRAELEARLREPVPEHGTTPEAALAQLERDVFPYISHVDHPRFFAFIPSPSNYVSVMAEALAVGLNVFAGTWIESSGPAVVELVTVDWLRQLCGMPEGAGGLFEKRGPPGGEGDAVRHERPVHHLVPWRAVRRRAPDLAEPAHRVGDEAVAARRGGRRDHLGRDVGRAQQEAQRAQLARAGGGVGHAVNLLAPPHHSGWAGRCQRG